MNPDPPVTPALVRPAEDLAALAAAINAEHAAGEAAASKGLEHYRRAGERLLQAKKQCGHGKWLAWLKANVKASERRARQYMALAKSAVTADLEDQWRIISGNAPADEEDPDEPESSSPADEPPTETPASQDREPGDDSEAPARWRRVMRRGLDALQSVLDDPAATPADLAEVVRLAGEFQRHAAEKKLRTERALGKLLAQEAAANA